MTKKEEGLKLEEIKEQEEEYIIKTYTRQPVIFTRGKGVYLYDQSGNKYLDFVSGLAVCSLGHCHPKVVCAIRNQSRKLIHTSNLYWTLPQIKLAKELSRLTDGMKSFFANSGAEANEAAIKLARKWGNKKRGGRFEIITAYNSFHGRTLTTITATAQAKYQDGFQPLPPGFKYVPFNDLNLLKKEITKDTVAVMLEPIQGEGGVYPAEEKYLQEVRKICDEENILLILDEVQSGIGRCGKMFAYQHYRIKPDILTLAKSIAQGVPMGIMLAKKDIASVFQPGDHASTFGGNPLSCAAAFAVLKFIQKEKLLNWVTEISEFLWQKLQGLKEEFEIIQEIRGKGLMIAIQLNKPCAKEVVNLCLKRYFIINAIGDNIIRLLPPLIINKTNVNQAVKILRESLKEVIS